MGTHATIFTAPLRVNCDSFCANKFHAKLQVVNLKVTLTSTFFKTPHPASHTFLSLEKWAKSWRLSITQYGGWVSWQRYPSWRSVREAFKNPRRIPSPHFATSPLSGSLSGARRWNAHAAWPLRCARHCAGLERPSGSRTKGRRNPMPVPERYWCSDF